MINREKLLALGARYREGEVAPAAFSDEVAQEVRLIRREAVWVDRSNRTRIALTGPDSRAYLQGLFTNEVVKPAAGSIVYGAFLTPKGRMLADARAFLFEGQVILDAEPAVREALLAHLDKYHFSERLEIEDRTDSTSFLCLFGNKAAMLFGFLAGGITSPADDTFITLPWLNQDMWVAGNGYLGEAGIEFLVSNEGAESLVDRFIAMGIRPAGVDALEIARAEAGVPRFGVEMTEATIPLEAGIAGHAVSYTKGCYIGQEIIARIDARGQPAKRLVGFSVDGELPTAGAPILRGERQVGTVSSALVSPSLRGRRIAMGYVHKDVPDEAEDLYAGKTHLWIVPRPFYPPVH